MSDTRGRSNGNGSEADRQEEEKQLIASAGRATDRGGGRFGTVGVPTERSENFGATLRRLGEILGRERLRLVVVLALTVGGVAATVVGPRLLGEATDIIVRGSFGGDGIDFDELHRQLLLIVAIYLASWAMNYAQGYMLAGVIQRSMFRLREAVENKLNRLPLRYVDRQARGDLLSRVTNDIDNLAQSLQQTISMIVTSVLTLVGVTVMMLTISPLLTAVAFITVPISIVLMKMIGGRARPRYLDQWRYTGVLNAHVEETFTGHAVVKSFGRQADVESQFSEQNDELHDATFGAQFMASLIQPAMMFTGNLQYVLIAVVGGLQISSGSISVGDMQAMIQYARQFSQPLTQLASMATVFQSGIASLERVLELLDADEQSAEPESTVDPAPIRGRVVFDRVDFSYDPEKPLIEDLSVVAEPGQTIAIVGPTGAGKTTLVNLLMRFYDLDGGTISLDGRDIAGLPRDELRSRIGMVLQDTWLFEGSIRDNLAYGNPAATDEQILEAARVCYVDRFVHHLPDGYATIIEADGENLSAGERQLITIARAFLSDPAILILDEATSSVDTRTEVQIQTAMNRLRQDRTSFVIAHRLSTIRGADTILVMEDGRIVEQGNHDQLLEARGAYHRLYNSQFEGVAREIS